jgi:hypothetical protein
MVHLTLEGTRETKAGLLGEHIEWMKRRQLPEHSGSSARVWTPKSREVHHGSDQGLKVERLRDKDDAFIFNSSPHSREVPGGGCQYDRRVSAGGERPATVDEPIAIHPWHSQVDEND